MTNNWQRIKLSELTENLDNLRKPVTKDKREKGQIPYYGATGVVDYVNDFIFNEPLLLLGEDGADWSKFADSAYIINGKTWVNNHAHVLRCTKIDRTYLKEYLNFHDLNSLITGGTRGKLTKGTLSNIMIDVPSTPIQEKIAEILSAIDKDIEKTDQIIQKTEKLRKGLMQELFTKGIGHKKFKKTKIGEIPEEWKLIKLSTIIHIKNGYAYKGENFRDYETKSVLLTPGNISVGGGFNFNKLKYYEGNPVADFVLNAGDVFVALTDLTPQANFLGFSAKVPLYSSKIFLHNQRLGLIEVVSKSASLNFIYYLLQSNDYRKYIVNGATGTTVRHTSSKKILSYEFPFPGLPEQQKIAEILSAVDEEIDINKKIKEKLLRLKKGLMQDIFNQKVEIN